MEPLERYHMLMPICASIFFIAITSVSANSPPVVTVIKPIHGTKIAVVKPGDPFEFVCKVQLSFPVKIIRCSMGYPSTSISITNTSKTNSYNFTGEGFDKGQCGVKYFKASKKMEGNHTCTLTYEGRDHESVGSIELKLDNAKVSLKADKTEYKENDTINFTCKVTDLPSKTNVTLSFGDEIIASRFENNSNQVELQHLVVARPKHNGKNLTCEATAPAWNISTKESIHIKVFFKPQPSNPIEIVAPQDQQDYIIRVDVLANPKPKTFTWTLGKWTNCSKSVDPDRQNADGTWSARLVIFNYNLKDNISVNEREYININLTVTNQFGSEKYTVKILPHESELKPNQEATKFGHLKFYIYAMAFVLLTIVIVLIILHRKTLIIPFRRLGLICNQENSVKIAERRQSSQEKIEINQPAQPDESQELMCTVPPHQVLDEATGI